MRAIAITEKTVPLLVELDTVKDTDHADFENFLYKGYYFIDGWVDPDTGVLADTWVAMPGYLLVDKMNFDEDDSGFGHSWFDVTWKEKS